MLGLQKGFGSYEFIPGRVLSSADLNPELVRHLAEYCAFRAREFRSHATSNDLEQLQQMTAWNWECEFGTRLEPAVSLPAVNPVVADARMLPHEWLRCCDKRVLKVDGVSHGDDHFFPGPCDIAWDLAGALIEWQMDAVSSANFLETYRHLSGDDSQPRLPDYLLAYTIFRMAWSKMAARASAGSFDESLLHRDYLRYRAKAQELTKRRPTAKLTQVAVGPVMEGESGPEPTARGEPAVAVSVGFAESSSSEPSEAKA
jgi:hypothetical protein